MEDRKTEGRTETEDEKKSERVFGRTTNKYRSLLVTDGARICAQGSAEAEAKQDQFWATTQAKSSQAKTTNFNAHWRLLFLGFRSCALALERGMRAQNEWGATEEKEPPPLWEKKERNEEPRPETGNGGVNQEVAHFFPLNLPLCVVTHSLKPGRAFRSSRQTLYFFFGRFAGIAAQYSCWI